MGSWRGEWWSRRLHQPLSDVNSHLGDYDNNLQWPFEGDIVIKLLNWKKDEHHHRGSTFSLNRYNDLDCSITSCVTEGEYAPNCWGLDFISHFSLLHNRETNTEYLQDDCLHLKVVDVVIYSTPLLSKAPSWQNPLTATQAVCDFTLTEFTKRSKFNNVYNSPPFYSHPHGYKLCLVVDANGHGEGKGTHISIFASLMRGDYDNNLQWPFEGDIVVELLNWREDNHHYRRNAFSLNRYNDPGGSITSCVTKGEYAPNCWGLDFIPHFSLYYNPDTNTEYLQDDCLRLRVVDVAVYSTPLHPKTPSWQDPHTATQSVCDITLTEFTKRKQFDNVYYSPTILLTPTWVLCLNCWGLDFIPHFSNFITILTLTKSMHPKHLDFSHSSLFFPDTNATLGNSPNASSSTMTAYV